MASRVVGPFATIEDLERYNVGTGSGPLFAFVLGKAAAGDGLGGYYKFGSSTKDADGYAVVSVLRRSTKRWIRFADALEQEDFTPLLVLDYDTRQEVPAESGDVVIAIAPDGHVEGVTKTIVIPAGNADTLTLAPDLNQHGDSFDNTKDYLLVVTRLGEQFDSVGRALPARDTAPPTVVSATVENGNRDGLVVVFSEAVYLPDVDGLSLDFDSGTPRTITAIEDGNGTDTVTLTLSGELDGTEVLDLTYADANLQDLDGNVIADGSTSVTNNADGPVFADTILWWRADSILQSGGKITQWTDKSGNGNHAVQADSSKQALVGASDAAINDQAYGDFDGVDDGYNVAAVKVGGVDPSDYTEYTYIVVLKLDDTDDMIPLDSADGTAVEFTAPIMVRVSGNLGFCAPQYANEAVFAFSSTTWCVIMGRHLGASRVIYKDGAAQNTNNTADNPPALRKASLGYGVQIGGYAMDGRIAEAWIIGHALDTDEQTELAAYLSTHYGL